MIERRQPLFGFACSRVRAEDRKAQVYFQFTPPRSLDYDANTAALPGRPVVAGKPVKAIAQANRTDTSTCSNRTTGKFPARDEVSGAG